MIDSRQRARHRPFAAWFLVALVSIPGSAGAQGEDDACGAAHLDAQRLRRANELLQAREAMKRCARSSCPSRIAADCTTWLDEIEVPSVILAVRGPDGKDAIDVRVSLDGRPLTERLDAKPIEVDPGLHRFRFEIAGQKPLEEKVLVREGERGRRISVDFPRAAAPVTDAPLPPAGGPTIPTATWVLGGVGVVGLAGFALFGTLGRLEQDDLDEQGCAPNCRDVDDVRRSYAIGDVSLAIGLVATGAALVTLLVHAQDRPRPRATLALPSIRF